MSGYRKGSPVVSLVLGLLLLGCGGTQGGGGGDVSGDDRDSTGGGLQSQGGDAGPSDSATSVAAQPTGELGVPLAPAADAVTNMDSGPMKIVQYIVPVAEGEATIAFYDDWTANQAGDYVRTESESGGVGWQNVPTPGGNKQIIAVLAPLEGDEFVTVTLTVGPAD